MSFNITSIPHAVATGFEDLAKGAKYLASKLVSASTTAVQSEVEALTALIPKYGAEGVLIERAAFSALGIVITALSGVGPLGADGVAAAEKFFLDAGADQQVITDLKGLYTTYKGDLSTIISTVKASV